MATNLALDERLIEEARKIGNHKTKTAAVKVAIKEYVQRQRQRGILNLVAKIEYWEDYNHKQLRRAKR